MSKEEINRLNSLSERITKEAMTARNKLITEAAIACWLDTHTPLETAQILKEFAEQLEDFG